MSLAAAITLSSAGIIFNVSADNIRLRQNVPDTHTVVKGDTLWDISGTFLEDPWKWPEIWHVNTQIENPHLIYPGDVINLVYLDGQPRLELDTSGRIFKLSPEARILSAGDAIETIPLDKVNAFLSRSRVVSPDLLDTAPYVLSGQDDHLLSGAGGKLYARGDFSGERDVYGIYRKGQEFVDPETKEELGIEALDIGTARVLSVIDNEKKKKDVFDDKVATMDVTRSLEEVRIGDILLRQEERNIDSTFIPSSPENEINAKIIAVEGGVSQVGKMDVIILNKGERESLKAGNVLAIYKEGRVIKDRISKQKVKLPDERGGLVMIFRTFEKVSYALVLESNFGVKVGNILTNP